MTKNKEWEENEERSDDGDASVSSHRWKGEQKEQVQRVQELEGMRRQAQVHARSQIEADEALARKIKGHDTLAQPTCSSLGQAQRQIRVPSASEDALDPTHQATTKPSQRQSIKLSYPQPDARPAQKEVHIQSSTSKKDFHDQSAEFKLVAQPGSQVAVYYKEEVQAPPLPLNAPPTMVDNLSKRNLHFTGRVKELKAIQQKLDEASKVAICSYHSVETDALSKATLREASITISGMGGIGKTQLAKQYAHQFNGSLYQLLWWFDASTAEKLEQSYKNLADDLQLQTSGLPYSETRDLVHKQLKQYQGNWLLIYDDASKAYLEERDLPQHNGFIGHIIITSRQHYGSISMRLKCYSLLDAIAYLEETINPQRFERLTAQNLAKLLGYFPLALAQAAAYINKSQESIQAYIDLFKSKQFDTLGQNIELPRTLDEYNKTVNIVMELALDKIMSQYHKSEGKDKVVAHVSLQLLEVIACINPHSIPYSLLKGWVTKDQTDFLSEAVSILVDDYSLLECDTLDNANAEMHYTVHDLVHNYCRKTFLVDAQQQSLYERTTVLINERFAYDQNDYGTVKPCHQLVSHALTVLQSTTFGSEEAQIILVNEVSLKLAVKLAYYYFLEERNYSKAVELYEKVASKLNRLEQPSWTQAAAYAGLAHLAEPKLVQSKRSSLRRKWGEEAIKACKALEHKGESPPYPIWVLAFTAIGYAWFQSYNDLYTDPTIFKSLERAEERFIQALAVLDEAKAQTPLLKLDRMEATISHARGSVSYFRGRYRELYGWKEDAIKWYKDAADHFAGALKLRRDILNENHIEVARSYHKLSTALLKCIELGCDRLQPFSDSIYLASYESTIDGIEKTENLCRTALRIQQTIFGESSHSNYIEAQFTLGTILRCKGQFDEALPLLKEAYCHFHITLGEHHYETLTVARELEFLQTAVPLSYPDALTLLVPSWAEYAQRFKKKANEESIDRSYILLKSVMPTIEREEFTSSLFTIHVVPKQKAKMKAREFFPKIAAETGQTIPALDWQMTDEERAKSIALNSAVETSTMDIDSTAHIHMEVGVAHLQGQSTLLSARDNTIVNISEAHMRVSDNVIERAAQRREVKEGKVLHNLDAPNHFFVGRQAELGKLREMLQQGRNSTSHASRTPYFTVSGGGGIGKTRLVQEYAHCSLEGVVGFPCYQVVGFIDAKSKASLFESYKILARKFGLNTKSLKDAEIPQRVHEELESISGAWLMIYDDVETPGSIRKILPSGFPHKHRGLGHVLLTSRCPSELEEANLPLDTFCIKDAIALLNRLIPNATPADKEELAILLQNLPLALIQAGLHINIRGGVQVQEYIDNFKIERYRRLSDRVRDYAEAYDGYNETVATTVALSLNAIKSQIPSEISTEAEKEKALIATIAFQCLNASSCFDKHELYYSLYEAFLDRNSDPKKQQKNDDLLLLPKALDLLVSYGLIEKRELEEAASDNPYYKIHELTQYVCLDRLAIEEAKLLFLDALSAVKRGFWNTLIKPGKVTSPQILNQTDAICQYSTLYFTANHKNFITPGELSRLSTRHMSGIRHAGSEITKRIQQLGHNCFGEPRLEMTESSQQNNTAYESLAENFGKAVMQRHHIFFETFQKICDEISSACCRSNHTYWSARLAERSFRICKLLYGSKHPTTTKIQLGFVTAAGLQMGQFHPAVIREARELQGKDFASKFIRLQGEIQSKIESEQLDNIDGLLLEFARNWMHLVMTTLMGASIAILKAPLTLIYIVGRFFTDLGFLEKSKGVTMFFGSVITPFRALIQVTYSIYKALSQRSLIPMVELFEISSKYLVSIWDKLPQNLRIKETPAIQSQIALVSCGAIGPSLVFQKKYDEAIVVIESHFAIFETTVGEASLNKFGILTHLCFSYLQTKKYAQAKHYMHTLIHEYSACSNSRQVSEYFTDNTLYLGVKYIHYILRQAFDDVQNATNNPGTLRCIPELLNPNKMLYRAKALAIQSHDIDLITLAMGLSQMHNKKDLQTQYQSGIFYHIKALQADPSSTVSYENRSNLLKRAAKHFQEAITLADISNTEKSKALRMPLRIAYAQFLTLRDNDHKATQLIEEALRIDGAHEDIAYEHLLRPAIIPELQSAVDKSLAIGGERGIINVRPTILAYFLLIKITMNSHSQAGVAGASQVRVLAENYQRKMLEEVQQYPSAEHYHLLAHAYQITESTDLAKTTAQYAEGLWQTRQRLSDGETRNGETIFEIEETFADAKGFLYRTQEQERMLPPQERKCPSAMPLVTAIAIAAIGTAVATLGLRQ